MSRLYLFVRSIGKHSSNLAEETKLLIWSSVFLAALFVVPNNKVLLISAAIFVGGLYFILENFSYALLYASILFLPFHNGKSLQFLIVPAMYVYGNIPFTMSVTFSLSTFMTGVLLYMYVRERFFAQNNTVPVKFTLDAPLSVFMASTLVSGIFSGIPILSLLLTIQIFGYIFTYFFIRTFNMKQKLTVWIRPIIIALCSFEGIWSLLQFMNKGALGKSIEGVDPSLSATLAHSAGEDPSFFRMQGTFSHPNNLGFFIAVFTPMLLYYSLSKYTSRFGKVISSIAFVLGVTGLVLSASRASWIFFVLAVYLVFRTRIIRSTFEVLPFVRRLYVICFIACIAFIPAYIIPRISQFTTTFAQGGGVEFRRYLLERSLDITLKNPLGVGLGMFPKILFEEIGGFTSFPTQPHNLFAQILVASGFLGLFAFLYFLYKQLNTYFSEITHDTVASRVNRIIGGIALFNFLSLSMLYPILTEQQIFGWFWILLSIIV